MNHQLDKYINRVFEDHKGNWWTVIYEPGNGYWMTSMHKDNPTEFQVETIDDLSGYKMLSIAT